VRLVGYLRRKQSGFFPLEWHISNSVTGKSYSERNVSGDVSVFYSALVPVRATAPVRAIE
jgi:hypothetical protein